MELSDKELLASCQKERNLKAFEILIKRHQKKVRSVIFRFLQNPDDLDDVSQEVFIKAFRSINSYRGDSSFSTWLCCIAVNSCKDKLKSQKNYNKKVVNINEKEYLQIPDNKKFLSEERLEHNEEQKIVFKAIKELPLNQQTAVILHDIEELSYEEISKISECPIGTVKSRLFNARKSLKEKLLSIMTSV